MMQQNLQTTVFMMRIIGWGFFPFLTICLILYPHGWSWGIETGTQFHPYVWMMLSLYLAWCYLLVRESSQPARAGLLFDFGIIGNTLHGLVMIVQAIMMWEHEMPHLWADIPFLFIVVFILWRYHPKRVSAESDIF